MSRDRLLFHHASRGIESVHSGALLFGYSVVLSLFMAAVMFLNG